MIRDKENGTAYLSEAESERLKDCLLDYPYSSDGYERINWDEMSCSYEDDSYDFVTDEDEMVQLYVDVTYKLRGHGGYKGSAPWDDVDPEYEAEIEELEVSYYDDIDDVSYNVVL